MLPRLAGSNESLGRQSGGVGTRNRGAGETKLELDRRKIERKIIELNKELELIAGERNIQCKLLIPFDKGDVVSYLNENAHIQSVQYEADGILLTLECKEADLKRYG